MIWVVVSSKSACMATRTVRLFSPKLGATGCMRPPCLFAKQNKANIEDDELVSFRALAKAYAGLTALQVEQLLRDKDWIEICHG